MTTLEILLEELTKANEAVERWEKIKAEKVKLKDKNEKDLREYMKENGYKGGKIGEYVNISSLNKLVVKLAHIEEKLILQHMVVKMSIIEDINEINGFIAENREYRRLKDTQYEEYSKYGRVYTK